MGCDIDIKYHSRAKKYLNRLGKQEYQRTTDLINSRIIGFIENNDRRYIAQDAKFKKLGNFESTVYYLRINIRERAVISIDDDPIFERVVVNIFSICSHEKLNVEIKGIMEALYQKMLNDESGDEEEEE